MQTSKAPRSSIRALTETAIMVAIAFVLSYFQFAQWPYGGSVTPASMLFILIIGIRRGSAWGLGGAFVYSCLQMLQGFYPPPTETLFYFTLVVLLDYVIAFTALGLSGLFSKKKNGILYAAPFCIFLRFLCHFASGILIWDVYAPEGVQVWWYSLTYNGAYTGAELIICMIAAIAIIRYDKTIFVRQE